MTKQENILDKEEIAKLLRKIIEEATSADAPLSEVLRLCMRLAKALKNEVLLNWVLSELNGYKSHKDLPDYRIFETGVMGHFSGSFGSALRNAHIPKSVVEKKHQKALFTSYMTETVAELEQLAIKGSGNEVLTSYWNADAIAYYQRVEIYQGMVLSSAWRILSKATIQGILDTIRTRVLGFALSIEEELDLQGKKENGKNEISSPKPEKVTQIVHNVIYGGNVSVGNLGDTVQQNIQVQAGDIDSLKKQLEDLGITKELISDLQKALEKDVDSEEQPGPATASWISRVMIMIGKGSIAVTNNTAGSLIAAAIMKYLGQ